MRVVKATSVSEHGNFFMEILDSEKVIEKISLVSKTDGAIKDWTINDSLVVKKENGEEVIFRIHGNKGPVYLVTEKNENGKMKKFRVTFYTDQEKIVTQPSARTVSSKKKETVTVSNSSDSHETETDDSNVKTIRVNRSGKLVDDGFTMTDEYVPEYMKQPCHGPAEWRTWINNYVGE